MTQAVAAALRRHRALSIMAVLTLLAWTWLFTGAGLGMDPLFSILPPNAQPNKAMAGMQDMPGMAMMPPAGWWSLGHFAISFFMWWIMMVAMMLPSAAPTILLYVTASPIGDAARRPSAGAFLIGYLGIWGLLSLGATTLQQLLERSDLLAPMLMTSRSRRLSAMILIAAGLYQLSPTKNACLRHCRSPAQFLSTHYRRGRLSALRMGAIHGSYCIGCCWMLMALLFVGGIMNLAWIALLTLMVAAEKLLPLGRLLAYASGFTCLLWGGITLVR